ncbi:Uncharacterised protein [Mycobacteroides abscessus]|nr:Uncharacterised protein [Mycobacteroides abscessus]
MRLDALLHAARVRAVDGDGAGPACPDGQADRVHHGPATPVARGERVEVRREGDAAARANGHGEASADVLGAHGLGPSGAQVGTALRPPHRLEVGLHGLRAELTRLDVEREGVGVGVEREDDPLHDPEAVAGRLVVGHDRRLGLGAAHASTPPLSMPAPLPKCGASLLSTIDSAAPMAMCMSRYL